MENSIPSRTPVAPAPEPVKAEQSTITESEVPKDEMPLNLYVESGRLPYICELLEIKDEYKHFDMETKSNFIDEYILSRVESKEDYKKEFENYLDKGKIDRESVYTLVDDLFSFLQTQKKLEDAVKEKEEFEKRDPLKMKAAQFRRWIQERLK